jgi:hypothetical protein
LRNSRALADDTDVTLLSKLRRVLVVLVALLGAGLIATVVLRDERSILPKDLASARRAFSSTPLPPGFRRVACADTSFGCYRGGAVLQPASRQRAVSLVQGFGASAVSMERPCLVKHGRGDPARTALLCTGSARIGKYTPHVTVLSVPPDQPRAAYTEVEFGGGFVRVSVLSSLWDCRDEILC